MSGGPDGTMRSDRRRFARRCGYHVADMTRRRFERLVERARRGVERAVRDYPPRFRREMDNVALVVEDEPDPERLDEMEIEPPDTLYGLYEGIPLPEREWTHGNVLPDVITIYQRPILEDCEDEDEVVKAIGETVIHEFGHYFGLDEDQIDEIEALWRGETGADAPATRRDAAAGPAARQSDSNGASGLRRLLAACIRVLRRVS